VRQRGKMGQPKKPKKTPKWQAGIDYMSPLYAIALALLTQPWVWWRPEWERSSKRSSQAGRVNVATFLFRSSRTGTYLAVVPIDLADRVHQ
jgi:hypothetical protein